MSDGITEARRGTYFLGTKPTENKLNKIEHSLTDIVKGDARISHICNGVIYYNIKVGDALYQLPIDCKEEEWKDTYIQVEYKAVTLMRWIRKAINNDTLIRLNR
jgi:hypothetical protein